MSFVWGDWEISITNVTFDFDADTASQVFKEINTSAICGLHEINPELIPDDFRGQIAQKIADKLGLVLSETSITPQPTISDTDWIDKGKRPLETHLTDY